MITSPIISITDELIDELELAADYAANHIIRSNGWEGTVDQFSGEMLFADERYIRLAEPNVILALLAERADLKRQLAEISVIAKNCEMFRRDAERFRLFAETVVAESSGKPLTDSQQSLFNAMNTIKKLSCMDDLVAMFDAAMEKIND